MKWFFLIEPYIDYLYGKGVTQDIFPIIFTVGAVLSGMFLLALIAKYYAEGEDTLTLFQIGVMVCLFFGGVITMVLPSIIIALVIYLFFFLFFKKKIVIDNNRETKRIEKDAHQRIVITEIRKEDDEYRDRSNYPSQNET